jgi:formin 2
MKDEMIHLYLNNSTMALAIPREACLLGAPRCHGIGMLVGAFSICKEQEQVREAILEGTCGCFVVPIGFGAQCCAIEL